MQSSKILNRTALLLFDLLAFSKGYRFTRVNTPEQESHFDLINHQAGFSFPPDIEEKIIPYKQGTIRFIAYHKNRPAGVVRLSNPKIANRPFDLYGVDAEGAHFEIQSLVVGKSYREGSQFVMLGLFKAMYCYSVSHDIATWISCSVRNVYLTMRRYSKDIRLIEVDFNNNSHPVTAYLYAHKVFDTCYSMEVDSFSPWSIFKNFLRFRTKNLRLVSWIKCKFTSHESLSYWFGKWRRESWL